MNDNCWGRNSDGGGGEGDCFALFTGLKNDHEGITAINIKFLRFV